MRNSLMKREDEADAEKKKLQNRCHNLEEKSVMLHSEKVKHQSCSFSFINLIKRDAQGKLEEELCHAKNEIEEMKLVSEKRSSHMYTHKFRSQKKSITCTPASFASHAHPLTSDHMFSLIEFWSEATPKNLQVNRSSKSRAKRSDSERQRLMSRCQSLKESGAQAIAEKVGLSNRGQKLKNL